MHSFQKENAMMKFIALLCFVFVASATATATKETALSQLQHSIENRGLNF